MSAKSSLIILLGLLALLFLSFLCITQTAPRIETDLISRSSQALNDAKIPFQEIKADGQHITLIGEVPDDAIRYRAGQLIGKIEGVVEVDNQLLVAATPPPEPVIEAVVDYSFKADYEDNKLNLSGSVPDYNVYTAIMQLAKQKFGVENITETLEVKQGAPEGFLETITTAIIAPLPDFIQANASLHNTNFSFKGQTESEELRDQLQNTILSSIAKTMTPELSLTVREKADENQASIACQQAFTNILGTAKIQFQVNEADIHEDSHTLLDQLAKIVHKCPAATIEISGHTDSSGNAKYNQALSQRRAEAVATYLISKKIPARQLIAKGFGETKPVSSNSTEPGRRKNRRIEFNVLQSEE